MNYYEVLVTQEYTSRESVFTYASEFSIEPFTLVSVPLQRKTVAGVIVRKTAKPAFETKPITAVSIYKLGRLQRQLVRFMTDYYAATEAQALQLFLPSFLADLAKKQLPEPAVRAAWPLDLPPLTSEQTEALKRLRSTPRDTVVLHGDTGSGKTRLYLERTHDVTAQGSSVLIMSPEIALIPQLVQNFTACFGDIVFAYHSQMAPKARADVWQRVARGQQVVIIGTRSALFLPFQELGLIAVDEAHEPAYKQEEGIRYHASRLASVLTHTAQAQLILGSATPLLSDIYLAQTRGKAIIRMQAPAITSEKTTHTLVVDMKDRSEFSAHPLFSTTLLAQIEAALQRGEQSLVYLNRRGTARIILCSACGWQAVCPHCDVALTYHHDTHELRCHTCGYRGTIPSVCPACSNTDIVFKSAGTKAVADWLAKRFPSATVGRFDTDNLINESLARRHQEVTSGEVNILVGTQMLVKGLDLEHLAVVGIIAADLSLQIPDYSAEERTYQLLRQAIGRVGRGHTHGVTVIQTFNPENSVIKQAVQKNYDDFYTTQLQQRQSFHFPPDSFIASFWISRKSTTSALQAAEDALYHLKKQGTKCTFLGPVLTFHPKRRGYKSAQIVVKSTSRITLVALAKQLPNGWNYDLEPMNLL